MQSKERPANKDSRLNLNIENNIRLNSNIENNTGKKEEIYQN